MQYMTFMERDCRKATGNVTILCGDAIHATDDIIYLGVKQDG